MSRALHYLHRPSSWRQGIGHRRQPHRAGPAGGAAAGGGYVLNHAPDTGGRINRDKCQTTCYADKPAAASEWSEELGIPVNPAGAHAFEYLGGIIGNDHKKMEEAAMKKAMLIVACARKLAEPGLPAQIGLLLLDACIASRFDFLARLCPPAVLRKPAKHIDDEVVEVYCKLAGINRAEITPAVRALLFTPRALGGRGFRSCEAMLERAYLGSQALIACHLLPALANERPDSTRRQTITAALDKVKQEIGPGLAQELLPVTADTFSSYFAEDTKERRKEARGLQKAITAGVRKATEEKLKTEEKKAEEKKKKTKEEVQELIRKTALRNANHARGASLAFTTTPYARHLALSDLQVSINERLHLGLPPEHRMPLHCACYKPNGQYDFDPWHGLSCQDERATSVTKRHDDVKMAIARWATRLGATDVKSEPRNLDRKSKKRPDLRIEIAGQCYLIDVTIRHPLAPSHVDQCARDEEKVLAEAEADKHRDYDRLAEDMKAQFVAFAVETTGRLGKEAMAFIRSFIQEGAKFKNVWAPREIVHGIYRTVAIAIARGNADIIASNLRESRIAAW